MDDSESESETLSSLDEQAQDDAVKGKDEFQEDSEEEKAKSEVDEFEGLGDIDPSQADDWRRIREEIAKKKKEFEAGLDPHLSADEKATMMRIFGDQMKDLERDLRKEKESQDTMLKSKLKSRTRQAKKAQKEVELREKDKTDGILAA